jgi:hypothetical protein
MTHAITEQEKKELKNLRRIKNRIDKRILSLEKQRNVFPINYILEELKRLLK